MSRLEAVLKFAPVFTRDRFDDPRWRRPGRMLYDRGSLRFAPAKGSAPLIVDHNETRVVGTVHRLDVLDWIDGPWVYAVATVTDAPAWLKRTTPVSFGFAALRRGEVEIGGQRADVVRSALVTEVSLLSPDVQPAEPCAEVLSLRTAGEAIRPERRLALRRDTGQVLAIR